VNADDPLVVAGAAGFPGRVLRFGTGGDVRAGEGVDLGLEGTTFRLCAGGDSLPMRAAIPGGPNVGRAPAGPALTSLAGASLADVRDALATFEGPSMRMQVERLASGVTVINDAYNANPASMAAALQTLAASAAERRLAVLGEMRELGEETEAAHEELGRTAAAAGLDGLVVVGSHADLVRRGAIAAGMPAERITVAADQGEAAERLKAECRPRGPRPP